VNMSKKVLFIIIVVLLVVVIASFLPFLIYFKNQSFSKSINDWADAATWFSLFISIITTCFLGYLSWRIHEKENDTQNKSLGLLRSIEKPVLAFYCEKDQRPDNIDRWFLKNIGKGPALNISICHFSLEFREWSKELVDCYSMGTEEEPLELVWVADIKCFAVLAFYQDTISTDFYCSLGINDQTFPINIKEDFTYQFDKQEILNKEILERILSQKHIRKMQAIENNKRPPIYKTGFI
jgi:hypothetical protein